MPNFDYAAWSTLTDLPGGIDACRKSNAQVLPILKEIAKRDFFSYFAVNLITPCMYFPTELEGCEVDRCEIQAVRDRDVPQALRERDLSEYNFALDGWCRKDMPSDFTEYFDLRTCNSRDTGYDGSRVWRFIHTKICFTKALEDPRNSWKRDYNRAVSGMHAAVNAEIVADLGTSPAGRAAYRRRLRDQPGTITNLYFAYMLTLEALHESQDRLEKCSYLGDQSVRPLMQQLLATKLLSCEPVQRAGSELRAHAAGHEAEVWRCRMRTRDLKQIMGCVECNLCRVHGTVMCLGLGATFQVPLLRSAPAHWPNCSVSFCHYCHVAYLSLFPLLVPHVVHLLTPPSSSHSTCLGATWQVLLGSDGKGGNPLDLDRVQLAALLTTAAKFGAACETIERFRQMDDEDEARELAKLAWLASTGSSPAIASDEVGGGVQAASGVVSEDAAKRTWLATLDAHAWGPEVGGEATRDYSPSAAANPGALSEDSAKRTWLATLNERAWGVADVAGTLAEQSSGSGSENEAYAPELAPGEGCMVTEPPEEIECDVIVVGGGPAGCTCALYASRANLKTVVLDKNAATGALAITSHIANYPYASSQRCLHAPTDATACLRCRTHVYVWLSPHRGYQPIKGGELLDKIREQAVEYGTDYRRAQECFADFSFSDPTSPDPTWPYLALPDPTWPHLPLPVLT